MNPPRATTRPAILAAAALLASCATTEPPARNIVALTQEAMAAAATLPRTPVERAEPPPSAEQAIDAVTQWRTDQAE